MLKFKNNIRFEYLQILNNATIWSKIINNLNTWVKIIRLKRIFQLSIINKKYNNYYLSLPLNNQHTRTKKPKYYNIKYQIFLYKFVLKLKNLKSISLSRNFLIFDYINRLWYKQWIIEWWKIRKQRLFIKKITYKKRTNINFPILKYKHIIRNFKVINKKKQKFLKQFNLGFYFYEYMQEFKKVNRFNKRIVKKKFSKYFILKKKSNFLKNK